MTFAITLYIVDIVTYVNNALLILIFVLLIFGFSRSSTEGSDKFNRKMFILVIALFIIFLIMPSGHVVCEAGGFKYVGLNCLRE